MQLTDEEIERLRRSGIRLDAEGRFWHEGATVEHHGLRAALWRWLDRNSDGRWVLRLDAKRFVYLDVDDAPHAVRSARWEPHPDGDALMLRLADDSEERLDPSTLMLGQGGVAYCRVKGGRLEARIGSGAWSTLAERIVDEDGAPRLRAEGQSWRFGVRGE